VAVYCQGDDGVVEKPKISTFNFREVARRGNLYTDLLKYSVAH